MVRRFVSVLSITLVACVASPPSDDAAPLEQAALNLALTVPHRARIGSTITVSGRGFHKGDYVRLAGEGGKLPLAGCGAGASIRVHGDGTFSARFVVPAMDAGGTTVVAESHTDVACKTAVATTASAQTLFLPPLSSDSSVWPSTTSSSNSDPWIAAHHDAIREMRPQLLVIRYANTQPDTARFTADIESAVLEVDEGTRYRAYANANAPAFLDYKVVKTLDLRDRSAWADGNSNAWPFSSNAARPFHAGVSDLFSDAYAQNLGFFDPSVGRYLTLGELYKQGIINEVWFYGEQATDGSDDLIFEAIELKEMYDHAGKKRTDLATDGRFACNAAGCFDPCAGNGCFPIDLAHSLASSFGVSMRIAFMNAHQAGGSFIHSLGHTFEGMSGHDYGDPAFVPLPYLTENFRHFANFDYQARFPGAPFQSLYGSHCGDDPTTHAPLCTVAFAHVNGTASNDALTWTNHPAAQTFTMDPYAQGCGNVHFPPNATSDYQTSSNSVVLAGCETFGDDPAGHDARRPYSAARLGYLDSFLRGLPNPTDSSTDPEAAWQTFWRQSMPGKGNHAHAKDGSPMKNWWPFLFY